MLSFSSCDMKKKSIKKQASVIRNLYYEQTALVRTEDELTDWVNIKRGVRQESVMLPVLFPPYGKTIMRNIVEP